jgi:two-component system, cell cycle sensor histidine kinase and response regulator CckA
VLKQGLRRLGSAVKRALQEANDRRERRQAERALAMSESRMRGILDSVDEGFIVVDLEYRILSANRAFCAMVNLPEDRLVGMRCYEVWHGGRQPCFEIDKDCPVKHTLETGTIGLGMHIHKESSGAEHHIELKSHPIFDASGSLTSVIETFNDVTEKRELEAQLAQSQKMESIGRLAGGVAHDFNNMLGVIIGHTELALDRVDPSQPLFADLQEILTAAERSGNLTRQLLAFARRQAVVLQRLDLNETVADILEMLRPLIGEGIELSWLPGEAVEPVKMDPTQIDQILANLCVNARDAISGIGRITIETAMATFDQAYCARHPGFIPGEYVLLSVSDNGSGMDEETTQNLFEPFFSTKEIGKGTGLGLATVYGIVKQNDGFISVHSEPGHGSVFKIFLPRHADETLQPPEISPVAPVAHGHETILLVEDEIPILKMTKLILEKFGYRVLAAATPGEALGMAKTHRGEIHLFLVDVIMPEMNGRDLAKQLIALYPHSECLFMSGYTGDIIAHHGVLGEGFNFIQKPFSMQALAAKVREVLERD